MDNTQRGETRGGMGEGASCSWTTLTFCFSLAALAKGAVVVRRGAIEKGTFVTVLLKVLTFTKVHIFNQHILTEQQQPLRVCRHISGKSGFFLPQQSQKNVLFSVLVISTCSTVPEVQSHVALLEHLLF